MGAALQRCGGNARHDAVAWGYARGADRQGVEIHQQTAVTDIEIRDGDVAGVHTDKGFIKTRKVLSAVAGWTTHVTAMVGVRTPLVIHPLQAMVTEPLKPWLDSIVVSASLHLYVSQSSRGELVAVHARSVEALVQRAYTLAQFFELVLRRPAGILCAAQVQRCGQDYRETKQHGADGGLEVPRSHRAWPPGPPAVSAPWPALPGYTVHATLPGSLLLLRGTRWKDSWNSWPTTRSCA